ncbi:MAG TPA: hypothetical protein VFO39_15915 [Candidatus Sulfotelmatobacter sp.]|nr:hypothetical protein [Candidatus Sulfotelmatobacter sp.]
MTMQPGGLYGGFKGRAWPAVLFVIVFVALAGLSLGGYRPAGMGLGLLLGSMRIFYGIAFVAFVLWAVWPKTK